MMTRPRGARLHVLATLAVVAVSLFSGGCSQLRKGPDHAQARQDWDRVRARVKAQLAQQQYDAGAIAEATVTASEALALEPDSPIAYLLLARCYIESDRLTDAQQILAEAGARGLRTHRLLYTRGVVLERSDRLEEALTYYEEASAIDPADNDALTARVECLASLGHTNKAYSLVVADLARVGRDPTLAMLAGHLAEQLGAPEAAVRWYGLAWMAAPKHPFAAEAYGTALVAMGRYAEARAILEPLISKSGRSEPDGAVRRALALSALEIGDAAYAERVLSVLVASQPGDVEAQLLLARAALEQGDGLTAMRCINQAARFAPGSTDVALLRASILLKRGDAAAALQVLDDLIVRAPRDATVHCVMGEARWSMGDRQAAGTSFARALEIDPESAWAAEGVQRAAGSDSDPLSGGAGAGG
jgi:Tfp pilus assembly protein PilF